MKFAPPIRQIGIGTRESFINDVTQEGGWMDLRFALRSDIHNITSPLRICQIDFQSLQMSWKLQRILGKKITLRWDNTLLIIYLSRFVWISNLTKTKNIFKLRFHTNLQRIYLQIQLYIVILETVILTISVILGWLKFVKLEWTIL